MLEDFPECKHCKVKMEPLVDCTGESEDGEPIWELIYWECPKCKRQE